MGALNGLGSRAIWARAPNFKCQVTKSPKIFSETVSFSASFFMISSEEVHNVSIYRMGKIRY